MNTSALVTTISAHSPIRGVQSGGVQQTLTEVSQDHVDNLTRRERRISEHLHTNMSFSGDDNMTTGHTLTGSPGSGASVSSLMTLCPIGSSGHPGKKTLSVCEILDS